MEDGVSSRVHRCRSVGRSGTVCSECNTCFRHAENVTHGRVPRARLDGREGPSETLLVDEDDRWIDQFGFGFNISGSRKSMVEARREHLRSIYEAILLGVEEDYWSWSVRSDGEEKVREWTYGEWERLEEILDMTEEEWCAEEL